MLFDDDPQNAEEVKAFNIKHSLNFQTVEVDPAKGVTLLQVQDAIRDLPKTCKKDEKTYAVRSWNRRQ